MTNTVFQNINEFDDVWSRNRYDEMKKEGLCEADILDLLAITSRDNARTPMQWNDTQNAGFTSGTPWINLNPNYKTINVASQLNQPDSVLNFYKNLIRLRKAEQALIYGQYELILEDHPQIYAYIRQYHDQRIVVICNLSDHDADFLHDDLHLYYDRLLLANYVVHNHSMIRDVIMQPYEIRVYRL